MTADFGNIVGQWASHPTGIKGRIVAACVTKEGIVVYLRSDMGGVFSYKLSDLSIPS